MIRLMLTAVALAASGAAFAKLPAPVLDDAAKAKAAETAARTAWAGKVDAYKLCMVQDRIAAKYRSSGAAKPALAAAGTTPPSSPTATPAAPAAPAAVAAAKAGAPTTAAMASQGGGTPVAVSSGVLPASGCADPGPFAYAPPAEKPLETSGAHSPASNASSPPSVRPESATMAPAKPATAQSKKP